MLLTSFVVHAIDFDHDHPVALFGADHIHAILHGEDRKIWTVLAAIVILMFFGAGNFLELGSSLFKTRPLNPVYASGSLFKISDPLSIAFRRGIVRRIVYD